MQLSFNNFISSAPIARGIENLTIYGGNRKNGVVKIGCAIAARLVSITVFPLFLALELVFKRIPRCLLAIPIGRKDREAANQKFLETADKVSKTALGILCSPLGLRSPNAVAGLFLKNPFKNNDVRPFGVEKEFGKRVEKIHFPNTVSEIQELVKQAKRESKTISIIGAGMSQGLQTVPALANDRCIVINMKNLNKMEFGHDHVQVQAGATWEQVQLEADKIGKSVIVKQASDIFSIGGSIGINCHGWAHEFGAIASTVESLEMIDADGKLRTLTPTDELFGCMFGTLGYFGIIVGAKLKLEENSFLMEITEQKNVDEFVDYYKDNVKGKDIPLFGGRLSLLRKNPLQKVCMVRYEKINNQGLNNPLPVIEKEPENGTRFQRICLHVLRFASYFTASRLVDYFWKREKKAMFAQNKITRNQALHPPIKMFNYLHKSNLHAQWLQEYFIKEENLAEFLYFLGDELKKNKVRLINATIRPTPKDSVSILPYAKEDLYAVVICFSQLKIPEEIDKTKKWMQRVNETVISKGNVYYQAYMPFQTREQFERCYGLERIEKMRRLKKKYDPNNIFSNGHTKKYYDPI